MSRFTSRAVLAPFLCLFLLIAASPALAVKEIHVMPGMFGASASGWPAGEMITVVISDAAGAPRITCMVRADGAGNWSLPSGEFPLIGATAIQPGETLSVTDTLETYQTIIPALGITTIDPKNDILAGRLRPARPGLNVVLYQRWIDAAGKHEDRTPPLAVSSAPDGTFSVDLKAAMIDLRRTDMISFEVVEGIFSIMYIESAPGLTIQVDSPLVIGSGRLSTPYILDLYGPGRVPRASVGLTSTLFLEGMGFAQFQKKSGFTVPVRGGDSLTMTGPFANFTVRVPRIDPVIDLPARKVSGTGYPGRPVMVAVKRFDPITRAPLSTLEATVIASATGSFEVIMPGPFLAADQVNVYLQDKNGNIVVAQKWIPLP
jgi:hypothetical protein